MDKFAIQCESANACAMHTLTGQLNALCVHACIMWGFSNAEEWSVHKDLCLDIKHNCKTRPLHDTHSYVVSVTCKAPSK